MIRCRLPVLQIWILPILLVLLQAMQPARAAIVSATGVLSAAPGGTVTAGVQIDSLVDFEAADLLLSYDPQVLDFQGVARMLPDTSVLAGALDPNNPGGGLLITYGIANTPISGDDLEFLALLFHVRSDAAFGPTMVRLDTVQLDPANPLPPEFSLTFRIDVMQRPGTVPVPSTAGLVLLALGAAAGAARRRRLPGAGPDQRQPPL